MICQDKITEIITTHFNLMIKERLSLIEVQELFNIIYQTAYDGNYNKDQLKSTVELCYMPYIIQDPLHVQEDVHLHVQEDLHVQGPFEEIDTLHKRELIGDQRSTDWLTRRNSYITASISAACAGLMGPSSRENYLLEKATEGKYKNFTGSVYTDKGNIFEPVTNSIYCIRNNTHIHAFGLIPSENQEYNFLAASTDGVTSSLINIEIKTLASRVLDGKIKKEYFHQMQHQMFCLGLKQSHFIEAKYDEYTSAENLILAVNRIDIVTVGAIIEKYDIVEGFTYEYSPICNISEVVTWVDIRKSIIYSEKAFYVRTIFWHLTDYGQQTVKCDPTWITTIGPVLSKFWTDVQSLKRDHKKLNDLLTAKEINKMQKKTMFKNCQL